LRTGHLGFSLSHQLKNECVLVAVHGEDSSSSEKSKEMFFLFKGIDKKIVPPSICSFYTNPF
jgi:hypothetical protein